MARRRSKNPSNNNPASLDELVRLLLASPFGEELASIIEAEPLDSTAATLRGISGALEGKTLPIPESTADLPGGRIEVTIGRASTNDLSFPNDLLLSNRHAALYRTAGQWYCRDLNSHSGTAVGSRPVRGTSQPVPPGAIIEIGAQRFALDYVRPGAMPVASPASTMPSSATNIIPRLVREPYPPAPTRGFWPEITPPEPESTLWRWVPPGEDVTIRDQVVSGGMLYVGKGMKSLRGYGIEPALLNPSLKINIKARSFATGQEVSTARLFDMYETGYTNATPAARRLYLDWLTGGRRDSTLPEPLLMLFLYGLERRTIDDDGLAQHPTERVAMTAELERLRALFPQYPTFQNGATHLLRHFDLLETLETSKPIDAEALLATPRTGYSLPLRLELALSRIARDKHPLPPLLGLAWLWHDPQTPPRTAFTRCPDEMRLLWELRFPQAHPKGIKVSVRNTALRFSFNPVSPTTYGPVEVAVPDTAGDLRAPSTAALRKLHLVAEKCYEELAGYSRIVGRRPELVGTPLALAQLPPELYNHHPAVQTLRDRLAELVPLSGAKSPPTVRAIAGTKLIGLLTGTEKGADLGKAESIQATTLLERIGFIVEPDARVGGTPLTADEEVFLARRPPIPTEETPPQNLDESKQVRALVQLLAGILEADPKRHDRTALSRYAAGLSEAVGKENAARCAALLAYLLAVPERVRIPRQAMAANLAPKQRVYVGDLLTDVAMSLGSATISPALLRRLSGAFRVLGLDEAGLYDRLHHHTTTTLTRPTSDLTTLQTGTPAPGYVLPPAPNQPVKTPSRRRSASAPLELDSDAIQRKIAETEQVSRLLDTIFNEEALPSTQSGAVPVSPTPTAEASPTVADSSDSSLDGSHRVLLTNLLAQDEWTGDAFAQLARTQNLLPGAALETINAAAWEQADEAALEGTDPIWVNADVARLLIGEESS